MCPSIQSVLLGRRQRLPWVRQADAISTDEGNRAFAQRHLQPSLRHGNRLLRRWPGGDHPHHHSSICGRQVCAVAKVGSCQGWRVAAAEAMPMGWRLGGPWRCGSLRQGASAASWPNRAPCVNSEPVQRKRISLRPAWPRRGLSTSSSPLRACHHQAGNPLRPQALDAVPQQAPRRGAPGRGLARPGARSRAGPLCPPAPPGRGGIDPATLSGASPATQRRGSTACASPAAAMTSPPEPTTRPALGHDLGALDDCVRQGARAGEARKLLDLVLTGDQPWHRTIQWHGSVARISGTASAGKRSLC